MSNGVKRYASEDYVMEKLEEQAIYITPQMFGAKGDGVTDDTVAINNAIEAVGNNGVVFFPEGTYLVSSSMDSSLDESQRFMAVKIYQKENLKLILSPKAHLKHKVQTAEEIIAGDQARYYIIGIAYSTNIQIIGGLIEGEAEEHITLHKDNNSAFWWQTDGTYSRAQGHGIDVRGSDGVLIQGCEIFNCFGDSILVGKTENGQKSNNTLIEKCILHNSIRQGISVTGADNTVIRGCEIYDIGGCSPQSGIDFEPNEVADMNINSLVDNCHIHDCKGSALIHSKANKGAKVKNCRLYGIVTTFDDDVYPVEYVNCDILVYHSSSAHRNRLHNCKMASCKMYEMGDDFYDCTFNPDLFNHIIDGYGATVVNLIDSGEGLLEDSQTRFYRCEFITDNSDAYSSVFKLWKNGGLLGSVLFDGCRFSLGKHAYQGLEIKVLKNLEIIRCIFTTIEETYATQFIELTSSNRLLLKDNIFDVRTLTTYTDYNSLLRVYTKDAIIEGCQFLATSQFCTYPIVQTFGENIGEIYVLWNYMPLWDSLGMFSSSTASKFISTGNIISSMENEEYQEKFDALEAELKGYTDSKISSINAQGIQQTPLFANSIEECTDTSKVYVLPDGNVYGLVTTWDEGGKPLFKDWLPLSIDTDGSIYNGTGFKTGVKLDSSGNVATASGCVITGFIPVKPGDTVRMSNISKGVSNGFYQYTSDFTKVGSVYYWDNFTDEGNGVYSRVVQSNLASIAYIRICTGITSETAISVNEEISYSTATSITEWTNTGHAFIPCDYEDRILALEQKVANL